MNLYLLCHWFHGEVLCVAKCWLRGPCHSAGVSGLGIKVELEPAVQILYRQGQQELVVEYVCDVV